MIIGVPKEYIGKGLEERRVGLSPAGVKELSEMGIKVVVENGAGEAAGFSNEEYKKSGASIVYSKEEAYKRADLVLKIRAPKENEWDLLRENQALWGYLHLAVAPKRFIEILVNRKIIAVGYEVIQREDGTLPVLKPMSEIAGIMSVQIAGRLLESKGKFGRGILLGGIPGIPPADVVIVGGGTLGYYAAKAFSGIGASVYVVDKDVRRLEYIEHTLPGRIVTMLYTRRNLEKLVRFADVLVCAVLVPGARAPILITREMVKTMRKGSVIMEFSIDQEVVLRPLD